MLTQPQTEYAFVPFLANHFGHEKFEISPLAGDASPRKYFRIRLEDGQTTVLMVWEPFVDNKDYPFLSVQRHFLKHGVRVPEVIAKSPAEGLILLEDLGDLTLERKFWENQNQALAQPFYEQALDELIKIHYPASCDLGPCTAFYIAFDVPRLLWELEYGKKNFLIELAQISLTETETKMLDRVFLDICEKLAKEPKTIAHRDFHSRNVMLKFDKTYIIDFQDARLGPIQYDLVSLVKDSYVNLNDEIRLQLLRYYFDSRAEHTEEEFSEDDFWRVFELQTIQRCFKACGSFASFKILRNDTRYLKYIPNTIQDVEKSLQLFPEYKDLLHFLHDHNLVQRNFTNL